jgi:hypothetical protein
MGFSLVVATGDDSYETLTDTGSGNPNGRYRPDDAVNQCACARVARISSQDGCICCGREMDMAGSFA